MHLQILLLLLAAGAPAAAAGTGLSEAPWRTGFVYSVYDPHYGRLLPEARRDANGRGHPLKIRGRPYARGFGCWRFCILEFEVPAGAAALTTVAGIDDERAGESGDTYFSVWADGKRLWQSPALSRDDPALEVAVPLGGARVVKLITDAQGYSNGDLADWCEPRWERSPAGGQPLWRYLLEPGSWHVRPELHPYHLAYRGEDLRVQVIAAAPGKAEIAWALREKDATPAADGLAPVVLKTAGPGEAAGVATIPLGEARNGLYQLDLSVRSDGKTRAQRKARFGLIDSHAGRPVRGSLFGVNHHEFAASYEALAAAGIEWSRQWFCWAWIEPRKGEWHWNWHDERMAAAREAGIQTIGVLGGIGQPAWSSPGNLPQGYQTTHGFPADLADWEEYVRQVATRYRGNIKVWESWNETASMAEGNRLGWSVARYADLHRRTYRVLKEIDPENRVLVCADSLKFVERLLDAGLGDCFDGIVIHPYRASVTPEAECANYAVANSGDFLSVFGAARAWLDARKRPDAQVWATEVGWALTGTEWPTISEETQGEYLPRTYLLAQGSGSADNVCWHDFGLGMFGICDGQGFPRPAILSFAGLVSRLAGAVPSAHARLGDAEPGRVAAASAARTHPRAATAGGAGTHPPGAAADAKDDTRVHAHLGGGLHALAFRRGRNDLLALWSEAGAEFAMVRAPAALKARLYDSYGNPLPFLPSPDGSAIPAAGRPITLEAPSLAQVAVARVQPISVAPRMATAVAGRPARFICRVENVFRESGRFRVRTETPARLSAQPAEAEFVLPRHGSKEVSLVLTADRGLPPGVREAPVAITLPGGMRASFPMALRVLSPLSLSTEPFECRAGTITAVNVLVHSEDEQPLSGEVTPIVPEGFTIAPASARFMDLAPGATTTLAFSLSAVRAPAAADALTLGAAMADGARAEASRALLPTIRDADGNGVADGWRINPENRGDAAQPNLAEVAVEPGHGEFFCQRIQCTRFTNGWIILHRDGQDRITRGKRYRVTFRARQEGLEGTLGVAVYHITPWQNCGIESQLRVGADWQTYTLPFTATRDSDNARFEFYFTEAATVWLEGMRLEEANP